MIKGMRGLIITLVFVLFPGFGVADTLYRCGTKNGAPWFTINVKPKGAKCVIVRSKGEDLPQKAYRCVAVRFRDTIFYRCEKDGIVWIFNRNVKREVAASRKGSPTEREGPTLEGASDQGGDMAVVEDAIARYSKEYGIPEALVRAVIYVESRFRPDAVSPAGAQGLMQLMPATARSLAVEDPFDPEQNIEAGVRLLRHLSDRFNGDLEKTIAAYFAGPSAVERAGGVPNASSARYVREVLQHYQRYSRR